MGKKWRTKDDIYYRYPACIPFLSMFYFPNVLMAKIASFFKQDVAFRIYAYFILAHYLLASFIAFKVMGLFGAITLTYAAYCIKPQTPAAVFTMCWMPGMLLSGPYGALCFGMALLGGYWPVLVYFAPVAILCNPACLWGVFLGLPQIIPFLWYWPRSIRAGAVFNKKEGSIPWWKLKDLFILTNDLAPTNGVHYPEVAMYMGIALLLIGFNWWDLIALIAVLVSCGLLPFHIQRIPSRCLFLATTAIAISASMGKTLQAPLILLQSFLLLKNSSIYPSFPFSQWWDKPSKLYKNHNRGSYPHSTGYLFNERISEYKGAFRLKDEYVH